MRTSLGGGAVSSGFTATGMAPYFFFMRRINSAVFPSYFWAISAA